MDRLSRVLAAMAAFVAGIVTSIASVVTTTSDDGPGSLRQALIDAANQPASAIVFSIPTSDPGYSGGVFRIHVLSPLPFITADQTSIDGSTQPGYIGSPIVVLDGSKSASGMNGLQIQAAACVIRGLTISSFSSNGVAVIGRAAVNNVIQACFIGMDASGLQAAENGSAGVLIGDGAALNVIGGPASNLRNVISGNATNGVSIHGMDTDRNIVQGNWIGIDAVGGNPLANGHDGVEIWGGAASNIIGGSVAGARNVASGNGYFGISVSDTNTVGNLVLGNYCGVDPSGLRALGNLHSGLAISGGASHNAIGGSAPGEGNVSSGNHTYGIYLGDADTANNRVQGNLVGLDAAGINAVSNLIYGIRVTVGASSNLIGGATAGAGNVVSGNVGDGISVDGTNTTMNLVQRNWAGLDITGLRVVANGGNGIAIFGGARSNLVGGLSPDVRNVSSGNVGYGIELSTTNTIGNRIQGNYVGLDVSGINALGNHLHGIAIVFGASSNWVGGSDAGAGNISSGNLEAGIAISGTNTAGNAVQGNWAGLDASGSRAVPNAHDGVEIYGAARENLVGGVTPGARNVASGNTGLGIGIFGTNTINNNVQGNYFGLDPSGSFAIGNLIHGVGVGDGAAYNHIGDASPGAGNVASGNGQDGIALYGPNCVNNSVMGNYLGTDRSGGYPVANTLSGVSVFGGVSDCSIGGPMPGAGNVISGNTVHGISLSGQGVAKIVIQGNWIGLDSRGSSALGNQSSGIEVFAGSSGNQIGGTFPGSGNVVSANARGGILIAGTNSNNNVVQGNVIGADAAGINPLGNGSAGITVGLGAENNTVGGVGPGAGNVISGNATEGIVLYDINTKGNLVQGNTIGTDRAGLLAMGNGRSGILIEQGAQNNVIGLDIKGAGAGNRIANNAIAGVNVSDAGSTGNTIRGNSIDGNQNLGIYLNDGLSHPSNVLPNDPGDFDAGPNNLQNYPVLTQLTLSGAKATVTGLLNSLRQRSFVLDFYLNTESDPSGYGQGRFYLGSTNVTTDTRGNAFFVFVAADRALDQGVSATATDLISGDTSEFSAALFPKFTPATPSFGGPFKAPTSAGFSLNFHLQGGQTYRVQSCTNLNSLDWLDLTNFISPGNDFFSFVDSSTNSPQRFYRLVSP